MKWVDVGYQAWRLDGKHLYFQNEYGPVTQRLLTLTLTTILIDVDIFNQFNLDLDEYT